LSWSPRPRGFAWSSTCDAPSAPPVSAGRGRSGPQARHGLLGTASPAVRDRAGDRAGPPDGGTAPAARIWIAERWADADLARLPRLYGHVMDPPARRMPSVWPSVWLSVSARALADLLPGGMLTAGGLLGWPGD
jgi:hypothetical protein